MDTLRLFTFALGRHYPRYFVYIEICPRVSTAAGPSRLAPVLEPPVKASQPEVPLRLEDDAYPALVCVPVPGKRRPRQTSKNSVRAPDLPLIPSEEEDTL